MSAPSAQPDAPVVTIRIPAQRDYVSTLRLVAASLAARCDLTIDEAEDLRLAVDESCAILLPDAVPGASINTRFEITPGALHFTCSVRSTNISGPDRDGLGWAVLSALVSDVGVAATDGTLTITVAKVRGATPP